MKDLNGVRILIVEDNFIVADSLQCLISAYGGTVVAMVPSVADGLSVLASMAIDVAILDIHIEGGTVEPLADHLLKTQVPFFFVTGYGDDTVLPKRLRNRPRLDKPVEPDRLLATLRKVLEKR